VEANTRVLHAGFNFAETPSSSPSPTRSSPRRSRPGAIATSRQHRTALGFVAAAHKRNGRSPRQLSITPASDVLHELSALKQFDVYTFQAEDEIAGIGRRSARPSAGDCDHHHERAGHDLKAETMGLALAVELPLVVTDIQRAGPSTGMPTKTEQADLLIAMYGRHGESPVPIIAASTPGDCFFAAYEACASR